MNHIVYSIYYIVYNIDYPKRRRAASPPPRLIKSEFVIVEIPIKADVCCFTLSIALCRSNENSVNFFT